MTYRLILSVVIILASLMPSNAQTSREKGFAVLGELVGGTWIYEGIWPNGEAFKQEIKYRWGLNKQMLKVQTYGVIDNETKAYGLRNEGIRVWDKVLEKMKFYEFDVFGGITEGYCIFEETQFHYEYNYMMVGKLEVFRDTWKIINKDTYQFTVSMRVGDEWRVYTTNEYRRQQ